MTALPTTPESSQARMTLVEALRYHASLMIAPEVAPKVRALLNDASTVMWAAAEALSTESESGELMHLRAFADAFRRTYPNIRQLQDGFVDANWSTWDESVRRDTIILGEMVFDDKGNPRNE
jgi:hypothetical protein